MREGHVFWTVVAEIRTVAKASTAKNARSVGWLPRWVHSLRRSGQGGAAPVGITRVKGGKTRRPGGQAPLQTARGKAIKRRQALGGGLRLSRRGLRGRSRRGRCQE